MQPCYHLFLFSRHQDRRTLLYFLNRTTFDVKQLLFFRVCEPNREFISFLSQTLSMSGDTQSCESFFSLISNIFFMFSRSLSLHNKHFHHAPTNMVCTNYHRSHMQLTYCRKCALLLLQSMQDVRYNTTEKYKCRKQKISYVLYVKNLIDFRV